MDDYCALYCIGDTNSEYFENGLLVSIRSLRKSNPNIPIEIFYTDLNKSQINKLSKYNLTKINPTGFSEGSRDDLGTAMFLRLYCGILHKKYKKIIYLDGDTIILDKLDKLANLSEYPIYARKWTNLEHLETKWNEKLFNELKLSTNDFNINSGVLVIDPKFMNETNFCDKAKMLGNNIGFENLYNPDQIIIYMLCKQLNCLGTFDLTWNFMKYKDFQTEDFELKINSNNLVCPFLLNKNQFVNIVHYNSTEKPWTTNMTEEYKQFL